MAVEERYLVPTPWGWALKSAVQHRVGGVKGVVSYISRSGIGASLGTRNVYRKLFELQRPPQDGKQTAQAAVLLMAVGENPADPKWGLNLKQIPAMYGPVKRLRDLLAAKGGPMPPSIWTVPAPVAA